MQTTQTNAPYTPLTDLAPDDDMLFSTRNRKGKYLQGLILDLARRIAQGCEETPSDPHASICLRYTDRHCEIISFIDTTSSSVDGLAEPELNVISLLCDALQRQLFRLTGSTGFEMVTWTSNLLTQPVELSLLSRDGLNVRLFNPTATANRNLNALVELSDEMDAVFTAVCRKDSDLDAFFEANHSRAWSGIRYKPEDSRFGSVDHPAPNTAHTRTAAGKEYTAALRFFMTDSEIPTILQRIEAYEACLVRGTVRQASRWGQDDALAVELTQKRAAELNQDLTSDLVPLSRSLKETTPDSLMALATKCPLTHLAIEFGVSEAALRKRLKKSGWVSPRGWKKRNN
jgi:hypothetical protein